MAIYFTSDNHYFHKNILHLGKGRPFETMEEMHQEMIDRWNSVVNGGDFVYHIGDFAYKGHPKEVESILGQLNGRKYFISGNHDKGNIKKSRHWQKVWEYFELTVGKQRIVLCHYPFEEWNGSWRGSWHLHGHCHGNLPINDTLKRIDVGVDCHNFTPISFEQVEEIMSHKLERE